MVAGGQFHALERRDVGVVGYTTGVYDLFHIGHLNLLQRARERCDHLIVGVTTDELSSERKGKMPVIPAAERMAIVSAIRYVDEVVPQTDMDKLAAWERLKYDVLFVGDDWKGSTDWVKYERLLNLRGGRVEYLPYTSHTSSTLLRHALQATLDVGLLDRLLAEHG
jgi:glycerol-3-phosphate cytidylyltransferase